MSTATQTRVSTRAVVVIVVLVVLLLLRLIVPGWPWEYLAAALALTAVVLTLAAERFYALGDAYETPGEMNSAEAVRARSRHLYLSAVALGMVLFSALVPVLALPKADDVLRSGTSIDEVSFAGHDGRPRLNTERLKQVLADHRTAIDSLATTSPGERLLVYNCGAAKSCTCPPPYIAVADSGGWNLNDQTAGSTIRLCTR